MQVWTVWGPAIPLAVHMAAHISMQTQSQGWLDHHSQQ